MIHGWAMNSGVWSGIVDFLCKKFTIITVDLRGHGHSASMNGPYCLNAFADDLVKLTNYLNLDKVTAVGWSMGVSIIFKLLSLKTAQIDSAVLISGSPCFMARHDYETGMPPVAIKRLYRQIERNYPAGLNRFYNLLFTEAEKIERKTGVSKFMETVLSSPPSKLAALDSLEHFTETDLRPVLNTIEVPTLIIQGNKDRICLPIGADYMHDNIRDSKLFRLENTGHVPFILEKTEVCHRIDTFLHQLTDSNCIS